MLKSLLSIDRDGNYLPFLYICSSLILCKVKAYYFPRGSTASCAIIVQLLLLLAAPTWLGGRCGRHNPPPASSAMDFIFRRSDGSHVSVDTVHPSLIRSSSLSSHRWYHLQSLSSDIVVVSPLYVAKPPQP